MPPHARLVVTIPAAPSAHYLVDLQAHAMPASVCREVFQRGRVSASSALLVTSSLQAAAVQSGGSTTLWVTRAAGSAAPVANARVGGQPLAVLGVCTSAVQLLQLGPPPCPCTVPAMAANAPMRNLPAAVLASACARGTAPACTPRHHGRTPPPWAAGHRVVQPLQPAARHQGRVLRHRQRRQLHADCRPQQRRRPVQRLHRRRCAAATPPSLPAVTGLPTWLATVSLMRHWPLTQTAAFAAVLLGAGQ